MLPAAATPRSGAFIQRLESLRGLAALMVAIWHSFMVFAPLWLPQYFVGDFRSGSGQSAWQWLQTILTNVVMTLCNGEAAVIVFFVLSGFVLARSLETRPLGGRTVLAFYLRRLLRIYPMQVAMILAVAICWYVFHSGLTLPGASRWYEQFYTLPPDWRVVASNAALMHTSLNEVTWTLRVEVIVALFIPGMVLAYRLLKLRGNLVVFALLVLVAYVFANRAHLSFLYAFYAGIMLPRLKDLGIFSPERGGGIWFFSAVAALLLAHPIFCGVKDSTLQVLLFHLCQTIGALYIVGYICCHQCGGGFLRLLDHKIFHHLGRVSFSFYVMHFPVLYAVAWIVYQQIPVAWGETYPVPLSVAMVSLTVPAVFALSLLTYRYIELPFINLGKTGPNKNGREALTVTGVAFTPAAGDPAPALCQAESEINAPETEER